MQADVVVVGAGIAGLTTAALLVAEGRDVVLLEQHGRVGVCAGDYWRKELLFRAGATLVTGLEPGGLHDRVFARLGVRLAARPLATAMRVHLPDRVVDVPTDAAAWADERRRAFGPGGERFWRMVAERAAVARALSWASRRCRRRVGASWRD